MAGTGNCRPPTSTASTPSVGTNSKRRNLPKNAPGQRQDVGWQHGRLVEGNGIECRYCRKVFTSGGIYRLKHHLACTKKDVGERKSVSDNVPKQMWHLVVELQKNLIEKRNPTPLESDEVNSVEDIMGSVPNITMNDLI